MPSISRLLIRTAAVHLVAAMTCAVLAAWPGGFPGPAVRAGLGTSAIHLLAVGWITQLIFGVALWMFPRSGRPRDLSDRTLDRVAWALLNGGLLLRRDAEEPGWTAPPGSGAWRWSLLVSAVVQWGAVVYFAGRLWPRVRSR